MKTLQPRDYAPTIELGFETLLKQYPAADLLAVLGAVSVDGVITLPVLGRACRVDTAARTVSFEGAGQARSTWAILVLHYLCATDFVPDAREVSFSYFPDCRNYLAVFGKRIEGRFLGTVGRTADNFKQRSEQAGGTRLALPHLGYRFNIMPAVPVSFIRYEGDEEISAGVSVLYRADAGRLLPAEDRVVAAELLLEVLSGRPMHEVQQGRMIQ